MNNYNNTRPEHAHILGNSELNVSFSNQMVLMLCVEMWQEIEHTLPKTGLLKS